MKITRAYSKKVPTINPTSAIFPTGSEMIISTSTSKRSHTMATAKKTAPVAKKTTAKAGAKKPAAAKPATKKPAKKVAKKVAKTGAKKPIALAPAKV